ncbi:hypothetical protein SAMN02745248_00723 [Hathewaya proteolytica DSM 3090]|uniref:Uncharacterized protein n=1 Tax=Hathewaya proteolytica DSM 3090 TaxID=1121331 RepID=A0A1M6LDW3_9CLOT|nr:hypothetical protein [Hathewaya proteolytica]SHJ69332.1 hypothetical protein SAMN02745248_00723 [Hathewaya proteolytica DSM 3090]
MAEIVLSYVFIVILITGLGYLLYLLKDKGIKISEDYFGLSYAILNTMQSDEANTDNKKLIIRLIGDIVRYIESELLNMNNDDKEKLALKLCTGILKKMGFNSPVDENSIRFLIRICAAMMQNSETWHNNKVVNEENRKLIEDALKLS